MKSTFLIILISFFAINVNGSPEFMHINVTPKSCQSNTYEVELRFSGYPYLSYNFEIQYGDGTYDYLNFDDAEYTLINQYQELYTFKQEHSFPGAGIYKITARLSNRRSDISNMDNSVNTSLFVETSININPYFGCNHTPKIDDIPALTNLSTSAYFNDFSFIDNENDSLSFHFTSPLQDLDIPVLNYWLPEERDKAQTRRINKISCDPIHCSLFWNIRDLTGSYCVSISINEWRKVEGVYYKLSSSTVDYLISLRETENLYPEISDLQDTVIVVGNIFTRSVFISDPDGDSIQVNTYGDFFELMNSHVDENFEYFPGPIEKTFQYTPIAAHVRSKPYKAIYSATDKVEEYNSLNNTKSMYIWIAGRDHLPNPPEKFVGQAVSKNLVNIYWNDSDEELGYIIERADLHFPQFVRLAILPANATSFNDSSVVENNTYQYRITAVGTQMSDYEMVSVSTPDILTAMDEIKIINELKIFPNPNSGSFDLQYLSSDALIEIMDLSGKKVWSNYLEKPSHFEGFHHITTELSSGIYILNLDSWEFSSSQKIIIHHN